jgi:signal transduction histidine kinase
MIGRRKAFAIGLQSALRVHLQRYARRPLRLPADDAPAAVAYGDPMRISPRLIDAGLVVVVAAAMALTISVAEEDDATRDPDALAYLIGFGVAALLPLRRRWPMGVLVGSAGLLFVYYGLGYPAFSPAVPLAVPAYFAAAAGFLLPAAVLTAGVVLFGAGWQTIGEDTDALSVLGTGTLADAALFAAVLLLGEAVRNRRAWANEVAERRVQQERMRIARELHDVMAHTIAGLNVQAGVAADVLEDSPEEARAALRTIREQSRETMAELRATVGLLRSGAAPREPAPGVGALDALVDMAAGAGVHVELTVAGTVRPLPGTIDLTAYRIVQESLTNVVRHAHASTARVVVRYEPNGLVVQVEDDGRGSANGAGGYGLVGMRERAAAVGGTLTAGSVPGGGFRVDARLPT